MHFCTELIDFVPDLLHWNCSGKGPLHSTMHRRNDYRNQKLLQCTYGPVSIVLRQNWKKCEPLLLNYPTWPDLMDALNVFPYLVKQQWLHTEHRPLKSCMQKQTCILICLSVRRVVYLLNHFSGRATNVCWWFRRQQCLENTPNKSITRKVTHWEGETTLRK